MSGLQRAFFAGMATLLRFLARPPFSAAEQLTALANWCEERA